MVMGPEIAFSRAQNVTNIRLEHITEDARRSQFCTYSLGLGALRSLNL